MAEDTQHVKRTPRSTWYVAIDRPLYWRAIKETARLSSCSSPTQHPSYDTSPYVCCWYGSEAFGCYPYVLHANAIHSMGLVREDVLFMHL